jgi:hypothetical protein
MSKLNLRLLRGKVLHLLLPVAMIFMMHGAMAFSQDPLDATIKIHKQSEKLQALFVLVEKQTPLRFAYDGSEVNVQQVITIKDATLSLKKLLL